jgi:hypothetical protein
MSTKTISFTPSQDALKTALWLTNDCNDDKADQVYKRIARIFRNKEYPNDAIVMGLLHQICDIIDLADCDCRKDLYEAVMHLLALCADDEDVTKLH